MKIKILSLFVLASLVFFLTSCEKENYDETVYEDPTYDPEEFYENSPVKAFTSGDNSTVSLGCVSVTYPFTLKLDKGQSILINNYSEFTSAMNSTESKVLDFEYPVNGMNHLGKPTTFNNALSLGKSYSSCVPGDGWSESRANGSKLPAFLMKGYCVELNYPVSLVNGKGNALMAKDEVDFVKHCLANDDLYFALPLSVNYESSTILLTTVRDMFDAFSVCNDSNYKPLARGINGSSAHPFDCFDFVYPLDVRIIESGTIVTINNENDLVHQSLSGEDAEFIYPLDIEDEFGVVTTINSELDFIQVFIACDIIIIDTTTTNPCNFAEAHILLFFNGLNIFSTNNYKYTFNYPITLIVEGTPVVLNSDADYIPAIGSPSRPKSAEIQYPVSVRQFGRTIILNNDKDVCDFYNTREEPCSNKPAHIQLFHNTVGVPLTCGFFVDFPVTLTRNGVQLTFDDRNEYLAELDTPGAYDDLEIVYPVSVEKVNNGQKVTFNSDSDICDYLDNCF